MKQYTFNDLMKSFNFVKTIPPGKMIYWDAKIIQLAHDMAMRFEDFRVKNASGLPPALSENLMILARQSLQQNIMSLIGRAQNFVDYKPEAGDAQASEEILRTKVMEMRETSPKFVKLLEVLNQGSIGHAYIELRTLLFNNTIWLVEHLDRLKGTFNLFAVRISISFSLDFKTASAFSSTILYISSFCSLVLLISVAIAVLITNRAILFAVFVSKLSYQPLNLIHTFFISDTVLMTDSTSPYCKSFQANLTP